MTWYCYGSDLKEFLTEKEKSTDEWNRILGNFINKIDQLNEPQAFALLEKFMAEIDFIVLTKGE